MAAQAFKHSSGPRDAKIALVGEAWGESEELAGVPFVGASGQELTRMLADAEIDRSECFLTNVFALRPPANDITALCGKREEVGKDYPFPPLSLGNYVREQYLPETDRLWEELTAVNPNVIVALGATACWALLANTKIGAIRGSVALTALGGRKVLPTYHPAGVLRNWSWRVVVVADFIKAKREAERREFLRPRRRILVDPTLSEVISWTERGLKASALAVDIETTRGQIDRIGFALSPEEAICIPFLDSRKVNWSYWGSVAEEDSALECVKTLCESEVPKIFQNGLYDLQYLLRCWGIRTRNCLDDTMILHHALYPEMQKSLGFLGSVYTNEVSWKLMRRKEEFKRDD